jgi:hypothetical protein
MTRGRKPLVALSEAYDIARKRGRIVEYADGRSDRFHFILFTGPLVTFVRVKRVLSKTNDPAGILEAYQREIRQLAKVPKTPVSARELWVRSPRGAWQFFSVGDTSLTENGPDGQAFPDPLLGGEAAKEKRVPGPVIPG